MSEIDWKNLVFGYVPTDYNVRCSYSDGKWGELRVHSEATMNIHISAAVLHYAQECFEYARKCETYAVVVRRYQDA